MIRTKSFIHSIDIANFCNENNITKEKIISICFKPEYMYPYVIFYEV